MRPNRENIAVKDLKAGDILNGEKITQVYLKVESVSWKTQADGWTDQPTNPNFRVNVTR